MKHDFRVAVWSSLVLVLGSTCGGSSGDEEVRFPTSDGRSYVVPPACLVEPSGAPRPHVTTFRLVNEGSVPVFVHITAGCSARASITSCASGFQDELTPQSVGCPCEGCPAGGAACTILGRAIPPGRTESLSWHSSIPVLGQRHGQACIVRRADLPRGRYRITVPLFATESEARDGGSPTKTLVHDFTLPGPESVDVPFSL